MWWGGQNREHSGSQKQTPEEEARETTEPDRMFAARARAVMVRRKARSAEAGASSIPRGTGQPLDGGVRGKMEGALSTSLSQVRVHTGGDSAQAAEGFNA